MSTPEQILAAYKAQIESLIEFSHKSFASIEKIVELNISTLKSGLEESSEKVKELLAVKDVQELVAFNSALAQPAAEKMVAYNKNLYELTNSASTEIGKLVESQIADGNKRLASLVDAASKNAPAGSESAVALVRSALSAASTAYDTVSKAAKQVADITEANVSAATNATFKAASSAASAVPVRGKKAA